jgi:hypothetical protein
MADLLATYCDILRRGVKLIDALSALYQPDASIDWAGRTLTHNANVRMAFADRLINPELTINQVASVRGIISHYLDNHWADYDQFIKPDPDKHQQILQLHAKLQALMDETVLISNTLRPQD